MDILTLSILFASVWLFDTITNSFPKLSRGLLQALLQVLEESDRVKS